MARVLGISVDDELSRHWTTWLAPAVQLFLVDDASDWPSVGTAQISSELRDTYALWRVEGPVESIWLDEDTFSSLPRSDRARLVREQVRHRRGAVPTVRAFGDIIDTRSHADGQRFVWWPSLVDGRILERVVTQGPQQQQPLPPSRHKDVPASVWKHCEHVLPSARELAGTFRRDRSEANCFATVMGAAGVPGAAEAWMEQQPFEAWLRAATSMNGNDDEAGTVFIWRGSDGIASHAAVTLGGGWAMEKPSQEWWTPRHVQPVRELIRNNRTPGRRLERRHIV